MQTTTTITKANGLKSIRKKNGTITQIVASQGVMYAATLSVVNCFPLHFPSL